MSGLASRFMWWENAVVYQVYVRSYQDTDGDGVGDLPGVLRRLEHIRGLGADAVWLSPIYPSPDADFGYDVSDFRAVQPAFGTLEDLDRLIARAHELGLRVLLDFIPCHTSTSHRWFRERSDYYVWADEPVNNWRAAFGESAWGYDDSTGRYFLHSFFPEQADLNWRNPAVAAEMTGAMRFWLNRGIDGFRLDALDRLMKDPELRDDPPAHKVPLLPGDPADLALEHRHSRNAPDLPAKLAEIRTAVGGVLLVGEVYLPIAETRPYLDALDVVFNFQALFGVEESLALREAIRAGMEVPGQAYVISNHDFSRLASRAGAANARAVLLLLLLLPGPVFLFAGDELGYPDLPTAAPAQDRVGRDPFRAPMAWDDREPGRGFTTGQPWLVLAGPGPAGVAQQDADPDSTLALSRRAIGLRRELAGQPAELLESAPGTIVLRRGRHVVAVNLSASDQPAPVIVERPVLEARPEDGDSSVGQPAVIPAHGGWVANER
jgi:alpha-glucosidase